MLRTVSSLRGLEGLRDEWEALTAGLARPGFHHRWAWHAAYCRHLADGPVTYHCVYHEGRLVLVMPLAGPATGTRMRALTTPRNPQIDVTDVVMADGAAQALAFLLAELDTGDGRAWDLLTLPRVPGRSPLLSAAEDLSHLVTLSDGGGSSFFECREEGSLERLSPKLRRNIDRLRRRAERDLGALSVDTFARPELVEEGYGHFLDIEASGWKGRAGTAVALVPAASAFLRDVLRAFSCSGDARVDVLRLGGRPAAAHLALRSGGTWYVLKTGYMPDLGAFGPGQLLLKLFFEEAARDDQVLEVNLITAPEWAERWHMQREPLHTLRIYGRTPGGFLLSLGRRVKEAAKRVRDVRGISEAAL